MQTNSTFQNGAYMRSLFVRIVNKLKLIRLHPQFRNKFIARNGILILSGIMIAYGFIGIGAFMIFVGTVIDEL